ncbi:rod shape-determining protein RodA [Methylomicrobium lacus]|uniref:rod shape-determining protein RodA n=1 Tax=Methylomicrobium lacus TaxID=136992 RepID=UPI00045E7357|nr:rod shape-determining protein RodA [Methylomicrobium lacus]
MKTETRLEHLQPPSMIGKLLRRLHIDIPLFLCLFLTALLSFVILYSSGGQDFGQLLRQAARVGLAFLLMTALAQVNPMQFKRYSAILFGIGIFLLIAVLIMGEIGKGAQRWLDLGFFRFQPSEMIKITTPMMIAWYLAEHHLPPKPKQVLIAAFLIILPTLLIAKQPDLGTALLVASAGAAVLFFAGLSYWFVLAIIGGVGASTPVIWHLMHDYQRDRVRIFLNPEADPLGRGYHIIQSKIAIGSGGIYGKGWLGSTQSELDFLPESSTDFIFAVFAEEFGLFGCIGLLTLYLLIIARSLYIASQARDSYNRLLASALAFTFFVYVFVNIGMVIGILPVVGVPLPLISYGGTSIVTLLSGFGILMSIHTHQKFSIA